MYRYEIGYRSTWLIDLDNMQAFFSQEIFIVEILLKKIITGIGYGLYMNMI